MTSDVQIVQISAFHFELSSQKSSNEKEFDAALILTGNPTPHSEAKKAVLHFYPDSHSKAKRSNNYDATDKIIYGYFALSQLPGFLSLLNHRRDGVVVSCQWRKQLNYVDCHASDTIAHNAAPHMGRETMIPKP